MTIWQRFLLWCELMSMVLWLAVNCVQAGEPRTVTVYTQDRSVCPHCGTYRDEILTGDGDFSVRYVDVSRVAVPAWVTHTPTTYDPESNRVVVGFRTKRQVREWLGLRAIAEVSRLQFGLTATGQWGIRQAPAEPTPAATTQPTQQLVYQTVCTRANRRGACIRSETRVVMVAR